MPKFPWFLLIRMLMILSSLVGACVPASPPSPTTPAETVTLPPSSEIPTPSGVRTLTVMTHDSFSISEEVIASFEEEYVADIKFILSGDAGTALNKAILSKNAPLADVFYGVDNTFLSRALKEDIFEPYDSPLLAEIPDQFLLDPQHRALPVDYGDVCLNYDKQYFQGKGLDPPGILENLLQPQYKSLLVVENPATSSPGLAFLLATIGRFGEEGYLDYWKGLVENDVLVVNDWETAYYTEFSRYGGNRPIVVSYASSPPFEVIFAEQPIKEPPTAAVVSDGSCFRQIEFVGILKGTPQRLLAMKWIDFMLSPTFQEDVPLQMFVFPVNPKAGLDQRFLDFLDVPEETAFVSPQDIAAKREAWIQAWTGVVLR